MKGLFITGTDTGVGKTLASAILTMVLQGCYWKPINSGNSDCEEVKYLTKLADTHFFPTNYTFKASLSPHQAAHLENRLIDLNNCNLPTTSKTLIVEGAGGVFVPLNQRESMLDLMKKIDLPVVIVSRGTLGTINHTLLTIEVLRKHGISIFGVIFNGELHEENQKTIEDWGKVETVLKIPKFENLTPDVLQTWINTNKKIREKFL